MAHTSGYMSMSNTANTKTSPIKKPRDREPLKPIQNEMAPPMEVDIKVVQKESSQPKPPPQSQISSEESCEATLSCPQPSQVRTHKELFTTGFYQSLQNVDFIIQ